MRFQKWIIDLERKGIVTSKPNPVVPFILGFISLGLLILICLMNNSFLNKFKSMLVVLTIFTFIFAIMHWIIVRIVRKK